MTLIDRLEARAGAAWPALARLLASGQVRFACELLERGRRAP